MMTGVDEIQLSMNSDQWTMININSVPHLTSLLIVSIVNMATTIHLDS